MARGNFNHVSQVHRSRGEAQVETAALRPESRRAHKPAPARSTGDTPADLVSQQECHAQVPVAAAQHSETTVDQVQSAAPMGGGELPSADSAPADIHAAASFADGTMGSADHSESFRGADLSAAAADTFQAQPHAAEPAHQRQGSESLVLNNPSDAGESSSKEPGDALGAGGLMEPPAQPAAPLPQRPMTAKKAPPRSIAPAQEPQRGRQGPPQDNFGPSGARQAVHVYKEEACLEDDSIDVVEATPVTTVQKEQESHGMLVTEMFKVMGSAEAAQGVMAEGDDPLDSGINLGRSKRTKKRATARVDTSAVRDAVESLVHKIAPLARSMDYLQVRTGAVRWLVYSCI